MFFASPVTYCDTLGRAAKNLCHGRNPDWESSNRMNASAIRGRLDNVSFLSGVFGIVHKKPELKTRTHNKTKITSTKIKLFKQKQKLKAA